MAVVQISKIQLRRGRKNSGTGLPQLASGELAWAIDTQELYIGNGAVSEGAPAVGNTKVLTEHDNILDLLNIYQYKPDDTTILSALSGVTQRSLQERLDEGKVNAASFGISGEDSEVDQLDLIQNAIFSLYLSVEENNRVALEFDPGVYRLTGTIYLPANVYLVGSGKDKTVFEFVKGGINSGTSLTLNGTSVSSAGTYTNLAVTTVTGTGSGAIVSVEKTGSGTSYTGVTTIRIINSGSGYQAGDQIKLLGSQLGGSNTINDLTITLSDAATIDTNYPKFDTDTVFEFIHSGSSRVYRNGDSGGTTAFSNTNQPRNIAMKEFSVETNRNDIRIFNFKNVRDSQFADIKVVGSWVHANGLVDNGIVFDMFATSSVVTCQRNKFNNVHAEGFTYAVYSDTNIIDNNFEDCYFKTLYKGVSLGENAGLTTIGPRRTTVTNSIFDSISRHGFIVEKGYGNRSRGNSYINVGNNNGGNANNVYSQIKFTSTGNSSTQDIFDRAIDLASSNFAEAYIPEVEGKAHRYELAPTTISLPSTSSEAWAFRIPLNSYTAIEVNYIFTSTEYDQVRKGTMHIAVFRDTTDPTKEVQIVDEYEYIGDAASETNLSFKADVVTNSSVKSLLVSYINLNGDSLSPDVNTFTYTYTILS